MLKKLKIVATVEEEELLTFLLGKYGSSAKLAQMGVFPQTCTIQAMMHDSGSNKVEFHVTAIAPDKLLELNDQIEVLNQQVASRVQTEVRSSATVLRAQKKIQGST